MIKFLNDTITKYGAYSILTGLWKPKMDENSDAINKMKILASTIEMDNHIHTRVSQTELHRLFNN